MARAKYTSAKSYLITSEQHQLRAAFALLSWVMMLVLFQLITMSLMRLDWALWTGTSLWLVTVGFTLHHFVVGIPEVTALIAINIFKRSTEYDKYCNQTVYLTGLSFKFPWEQAKDGLYINLRLIAQPFNEDFPAKDGPPVNARGVILWRPVAKFLPQHIAVDASVINRGLADIVTGLLSTMIGKETALEARQKMNDFQNDITKAMESSNTILKKAIEVQEAGLAPKDATYEWLFGIDLDAVRLADVNFSKDYQTALTNEAQAARVKKFAAELIEEHRIPEKEAMNSAMIAFGLVKKSIIEAEGEGPKALAGLLLSMGRGGENERSTRH